MDIENHFSVKNVSLIMNFIFKVLSNQLPRLRDGVGGNLADRAPEDLVPKNEKKTGTKSLATTSTSALCKVCTRKWTLI